MPINTQEKLKIKDKMRDINNGEQKGISGVYRPGR